MALPVLRADGDVKRQGFEGRFPFYLAATLGAAYFGILCVAVVQTPVDARTFIALGWFAAFGAWAAFFEMDRREGGGVDRHTVVVHGAIVETQ